MKNIFYGSIFFLGGKSWHKLWIGCFLVSKALINEILEFAGNLLVIWIGLVFSNIYTDTSIAVGLSTVDLHVAGWDRHDVISTDYNLGIGVCVIIGVNLWCPI